MERVIAADKLRVLQETAVDFSVIQAPGRKADTAAKSREKRQDGARN